MNGSAQQPETLQRGFVIRGLVQGVGFRYWTARVAERLGLAGTVANRPDGSVEVHVRGSAESVRRFADQLRVGPPAARVQAVADVPDAFQIVRWR